MCTIVGVFRGGASKYPAIARGGTMEIPDRTDLAIWPRRPISNLELSFQAVEGSPMGEWPVATCQYVLSTYSYVSNVRRKPKRIETSALHSSCIRPWALRCHRRSGLGWLACPGCWQLLQSARKGRFARWDGTSDTSDNL